MGYLDEWELEVENIKGLSAAQRKKLCLSGETLEGLRITGKLIHTNIITA